MTVVGTDRARPPHVGSWTPSSWTTYDTEWGMPIRDERGLYERICLEGFQAGLSWATILRKRPAFRAAFADFDPDVVATYTDDRRRAAARRRRHHPPPRQDPGHHHQRPGHHRAARARAVSSTSSGASSRADTPRPADHSEVPTVSDESKALSKALRKKGFAFVGPRRCMP